MANRLQDRLPTPYLKITTGQVINQIDYSYGHIVIIYVTRFLLYKRGAMPNARAFFREKKPLRAVKL